MIRPGISMPIVPAGYQYQSAAETYGTTGIITELVLKISHFLYRGRRLSLELLKKSPEWHESTWFDVRELWRSYRYMKSASRYFVTTILLALCFGVLLHSFQSQ